MELMIVVAVLGVLAGVLIPSFQGVVADAKNATAKANVRLLKVALLLYENEFNEIPRETGEYGIYDLEEAMEDWESNLRIITRIPEDPWGQTTGELEDRDKIRYQAYNADSPDERNTFAIYSIGENERDDVINVSDDRISLRSGCDDIIATNASQLYGTTTGEIL